MVKESLKEAKSPQKTNPHGSERIDALEFPESKVQTDH